MAHQRFRLSIQLCLCCLPAPPSQPLQSRCAEPLKPSDSRADLDPATGPAGTHLGEGVIRWAPVGSHGEQHKNETIHIPGVDPAELSCESMTAAKAPSTDGLRREELRPDAPSSIPSFSADLDVELFAPVTAVPRPPVDTQYSARSSRKTFQPSHRFIEGRWGGGGGTSAIPRGQGRVALRRRTCHRCSLPRSRNLCVDDRVH
ncbi:hypothetical protein LZ30DRAFT_33628 [Colletotrichum cereale]|nr:hypothetical protein LZ30DRAFT_33628 [Colletotrichum cereale]